MAKRYGNLAVGEVVQGDFELRETTLVLVFQVNCPGCFTYALPLAEAIHRDAGRSGISVKALSTAFEDFDLNTAEHTRALVEQGKLVGATRRALGAAVFDGTISLPVGVDAGIEHGIGETFAACQLMGTPSWIVLEPDGTLLASHFGRLPERWVSPGYPFQDG